MLTNTMKTTAQKVIASLASLILIVALMPAYAFAAPVISVGVQEEIDLPASGMWGTCPWEIDEQGTLTVHPGQGADTHGLSPWKDYGRIIKRVLFVVENGRKIIAPADLSRLFPTYETHVGTHFGYANSIEQIDFHGLDTSQTTDMSDMFFGCSTITNLDLSGFDTSRVTDMSGMFSTWDRSGMWASLGDSSLVSLNLSGFDTSQVTDMREMFRGCSVLKSVSLGNKFSFKGAKEEVQTTLPGYYWRSASDACQAYTAQQIADTRNNIADLYERGVVPVGGVWGTCPWEIDAEGTLTVYPGEGVDTLRPGLGFDEKIKRVVFVQEDGRKVIAPSNSSHLLSYKQAASIDLSGLDTSRVTNMSSMFSGCSSLFSLDLSGLDTSQVTDMVNLFSDCSSLSSLCLSGLDTSNVKIMSSMFKNCSSLTSLDLSGFDTSSTTAMGYMFLGCSSLTSLDISGFDTSSAAPGSTWDGLNAMFGKCDKLSTVSLSEKFSFRGASDTVQTTLPEGSWLSRSDGKSYTAQQIAEERNNVADTYTRGDIPVVPTTPITVIDLDKTSFIYSISNPPKPKVTVKAGFAVLSEGVDYDITWPRDLQSAETKEVKVTAKGKYSGTLTASYEVVPAQLPVPMIDRDSFVYDGKEKRPAVTVTDGSTKLVEGTDYTVAWPADVTNVGEKVITVTGGGNYAGARTLTYRVEEPAVQPPSGPVITTGDGQSWKPGSAAGATFRSTAALADFLRVIVDDVVVDRANYDLSEGSTIVTLKPEYLAELVPGNHEIKIVSTTGTAKAPFVTEPAPDTPSEPSKSDEPNNPGITDPDVQLMYRLYNPNSGEHFYTASVEERDHLDSVGWDYEGHAWTAPKSSNTPVYRLYSGTDHHYTTSAYERDELVKVGWSYEGVGWYSDDAKGIGLHRLFNPNVNPKAARNNSGSHHYTTSDEERDHLVSLGWRYEDYGWYGVR